MDPVKRQALLDKLDALKAASLSKAACAAWAQTYEPALPLATLLTIYERSSWAVMESNDWAGFKALVAWAGPPERSSYKQAPVAFPRALDSWVLSKLSELTGISHHEIGFALLCNHYKASNFNFINNLSNDGEGVDKQSEI
jgi:hypothetical protein